MHDLQKSSSTKHSTLPSNISQHITEKKALNFILLDTWGWWKQKKNQWGRDEHQVSNSKMNGYYCWYNPHFHIPPLLQHSSINPYSQVQDNILCFKLCLYFLAILQVKSGLSQTQTHYLLVFWEHLNMYIEIKLSYSFKNHVTFLSLLQLFRCYTE